MLRPGSLIARLAALAILAVLVLACYQFVVQPLMRAHVETQEKIVQSNELLQRYKALAAEQPALTERLAALEEDDQSLSGYLEGPSDALAAAQLQDLAADAIAAADGEIRSTQILPVTDVEDGPSVRKTGLKLRFSSTIDGLASTLYDLETIEPHLFVDQLVVVSERGRRGDLTAGGNQRLDVRLDLFGYVRKAE